MLITNDYLSHDRMGLITGSECSVLFPKKSAEVGQRSYAKKLANEMFFNYYDSTSTWQTEHGNMNEIHAENHFVNLYGVFGSRPETIIDKENQLGGSPDFVSVEFGCDWKCPTTLQGWLDYLHEGISPQQYYQCQMYMHLTGLRLWKVCAYLTETLKMIDNGLSYPVDELQRMIIIDVPFEEGFSKLLLERAPKVIKMRDEYLRILHNTFSGREATEQERAEHVQFDIENEPEFDDGVI